MTTKLSYYLLTACLLCSTFQAALSQVINYETKVTIDGNGKKTTQKTIAVRVNNKQENWLSHIELRHSPKQQFSFGYAQIVDAEGKIVRKLKKKELVTRSELSYQAFYQDDLVTEFELYWNQYPYSVEYAYTIEEDDYLYLTWWTPLLYANVPTIASSLELNLPSGYEVKIKAWGSTTYEAAEVKDRKIMTWRSSLTKMPGQEIYAPPSETLIPVVKVAPAVFKYGVTGSLASWPSFGLWLEELNEGTDQLTPQEKSAIEQLTGGIDDEKEIIKRIYHYLQDHTKYVNVAIDVGGLKSYPATYVCENKYGDCKALTTYMKSMLKHVGIESFYSVVSAGENEKKIDLDFPSQQFNHVILMVPVGKDTIWLENTSSALPFDYLGTFTQNRYALAVDRKESRLVKTPELLPDDVLVDRAYRFQLSDEEEAKIELALTLRGRAFEDFRHFLSSKEDKRQDDAVLKHAGISGLSIGKWEVAGFQRDSAFVSIELEGRSPSVTREIGPFKVINPLSIALPYFEKPNERKLDVVIPYPINRSDKSVYELKGLETNEVQIPEDMAIENEYGRYSASYAKEGNHILVNEQFTLFANEIPLSQYGALYSFIDSITTYQKKSAILLP